MPAVRAVNSIPPIAEPAAWTRASGAPASTVAGKAKPPAGRAFAVFRFEQTSAATRTKEFGNTRLALARRARPSKNVLPARRSRPSPGRVGQAHRFAVLARERVAVFPCVKASPVHGGVGIAIERVGSIANEVACSDDVVPLNQGLATDRTGHVRVEERHIREILSRQRGRSETTEGFCRRVEVNLLTSQILWSSHY